jgi:hypothetical protein
MRKVTAAFLLIGIMNSSTSKSLADESVQNFSETATHSKTVLKLAESVGLTSDFEQLFNTEPGSVERELAEVRLLRHLWQTQLQLHQTLTEIDEEKTMVSMAIQRVENRQTRVANTLNSMNFLSSGIIGVVGNGIFIPAPPPRPEIPNILFSTANGISTAMSVLSLAAVGDCKTSFSLGKESMLAPLFGTDIGNNGGDRVWHFLNYSDEPSQISFRQKLLRHWEEDEKIAARSESAQFVITSYGLGAEPCHIKLSKLRMRQQMLDNLQHELLNMSISLSKLGHCI